MPATTWRVNNSTALGGEVCAPWQTNHAYALGARCVCRIAYATTTARALVMECTTAGTSHATTEPTWGTTVGATIADGAGTLVWTCRSPGDGTWNNASAFLFYVMNHTTIAAGDLVYIDDGHSDAVDLGFSAKDLTGSATASNPIRIYCVDKADDSLSAGAIVAVTGIYVGYTHTGTVYSYGVTYKSAAPVSFSSSAFSSWILEGDGTSIVLDIDGAKAINVGAGASGKKTCALIIKNGSIQGDNAGMTISLQPTNIFRWKGGQYLSATGVTALFAPGTYNNNDAIIEDVDLDQVGNGANARSLVDVNDGDAINHDFSRCKIPSAAGFTVISGTWQGPNSGRVRLHHCSSGDRYYDFHEQSYEGNVTDETTIVRTGGASDGTTAQAWKMISSANTVDNISALESPPITIWNSATTEKTFTIECIWDSATAIQNDEIWMELEYPVDNTSGLGAVANDKCAMLGAAADQTTSVLDWENEDDLTNPNTFKLSVTATAGKAGPVTARVYLAKASTTVYVDPLITIT